LFVCAREVFLTWRSLPAVERDRRQRDLETGVARRADVLRDRRVAGGRRELTIQQQVVRGGAIAVDGAREAAIEQSEVRADVECPRLLPPELGVRERAG